MRSSLRHGAVVLGLAGAGAVLAASGQDWVTADLVTGVLPQSTLTGGQVSAAAVPVAVAAAAAAVVQGFSGRVVRLLIAGGMVVAGVLLAASLLGVLRDEGDLVELAWRESAGIRGGSGSGAGSATVSGWAWVAAAGAMTIAVAGVTGVAGAAGRSGPGSGPGGPADPGDGPDRRRTSSRPSSRFDRPVSSETPVSGDRRVSGDGAGREDVRITDPVRAWDALSRGDDPTA